MNGSGRGGGHAMILVFQFKKNSIQSTEEGMEREKTGRRKVSEKVTSVKMISA